MRTNAAIGARKIKLPDTQLMIELNALIYVHYLRGVEFEARKIQE
jgi:hypothetical protein